MLAYEEARADGAATRVADGGGGSDGEAEEQAVAAGEEEEEEEAAFSPERGNVAVGSAYDGWAFRIDQFAEMYAGRWGWGCVCGVASQAPASSASGEPSLPAGAPPCSALLSPRVLAPSAAKMGCKAAALQRALWGEYAYQAKTKRIVRIKVRGELGVAGGRQRGWPGGVR